MKATIRLLLAAVLGLSGLMALTTTASAQVAASAANCAGVAATDVGGGTDIGGGNADTGEQCNNSGDVEGEVGQDGSASSGDGVAGQVAGVVSAGDASVDATNRSDDVDVSTGNASGTNTAALSLNGVDFGAEGTLGFSLLNCPQIAVSDIAGGTDIGGDNASTGANACENTGNIDGEIGQSADAASGDGVGGQVIGVVTSAGGSADLVLDNESTDSEVDSGNATFGNAATDDQAGVSFTAGP